MFQNAFFFGKKLYLCRRKMRKYAKIFCKMIIRRDFYLNQLIGAQHNGMVKVVTGIRRCGKSFLLFNLFRHYLDEQGVAADHIVEMDFEDYENKRYRAPDEFYRYAKSRITDDGQYYFLLDEVQRLGEFEDVLNGFLRRPNVELYVTGSNAKFLSKDIITEFSGRGYQIHMQPLCYAEFMSCYDGAREKGLEDYLNFGGIPQVVLSPTVEEKTKLLKQLLDETYISDILNRNNVKNTAELDDLFNILASNIGALTNPQKLSDTFRSVLNIAISAATVKNYIDFFCDSFLLERVNRYDVKGRKYIGTPQKYYFTDLGLRNARLDFRQLEMPHLMENAIYNELRRRGFSVDVGVVTANGKDAQGRSVRSQLEVDFVCNKGSKRYYIQSALNLDTPEKQEQEFRSLRKIDDNFKKIVIVGSPAITHQNSRGIGIINIFDFLLDDESLRLFS